MKAYHYTEIAGEPVEASPGALIRWAIGKNAGAPNFVTRIIDLQPGATSEYHQHHWEHEVFVLQGEGDVRDAQGKTRLGPGTCVYVEPDEIHQFINTGDGVLRFICIIPYPPEN